MRDKIKEWIFSFYQSGSATLEEVATSEAFLGHKFLWTLALFAA